MTTILDLLKSLNVHTYIISSIIVDTEIIQGRELFYEVCAVFFVKLYKLRPRSAPLLQNFLKMKLF